MKTVVIVGASRGIGLELVKHYQAAGCAVVATCRTKAPELSATGAEVVEGVDVTRDEGVAALARALEGRKVDVLVHNAGVLERGGLDDLDLSSVSRQLEANAVAPLRVVRALRQRLAQGSKVALVTSRMGSIADNGSGGYYGYRMSKAALNAAGKSLAIDLAPRGVAVVILHPGFVRTEMTGGAGDTSPADAAKNLATRIDELAPERTGRFLHAKGDELPW